MRRPLPLVLIICALLAGCGEARSHTTTSAVTSRTTTVTNPTAQLEQAVRAALQANATVSDYVLEHNAIPASASQSTDGPALAGMRASAAQRQTGHITVRVLSNSIQIRSITLAPSYATATAIATDISRVLPYRRGRALGKVVTSSEQTRFELHRVDNTMSFVVWKVAPA